MATALLADPVVRETIWAPQGRPQEALVACPIEDVFYGGARGGGKTDGLLGDFAVHAGRYGAHAKGILFRRTYPELEEVERRAREIFTPLGWIYNETKKTWTAPNGATLKLRYLLRDKDADNYQGHSYTWQGWDELTNWPSSAALDKLWATLRSAHGVPCYRRSTGNPGGAGHGWVKRRYIDPHPDGYVVYKQVPNAKKPELTIETVFIPSKLEENPLIAGQGYESRIAAAAGDNEALWEAWRHGRWDVFVGQAYSEFRKEFHVVRGKSADQFASNTEWFATMDWGYNRGTYGLWAVTSERRIELVWEFYDQFTQLDAEAAAIAIMEASTHWPRPRFIHADEQMWQKVGTRVTLEQSFREGLKKLSDTPPILVAAKHPLRSREVKVALIHEWLTVGKHPGSRDPAVSDGGVLAPWAAPHLRIHERCANTLRVLQEIPSDPDNPNDVDPDYADDHPHDMVGFAVASRPPIPKTLELTEVQRAANIVANRDKAPSWDAQQRKLVRPVDRGERPEPKPSRFTRRIAMPRSRS
jgi:hypothetical protein